MRVRVLPYKKGSASANRLAKGLGAKRLLTEGSLYVPRETDAVVNWGCSSSPEWRRNPIVFNKPEAVSVALHKLKCLQSLSAEGVRTVPWTTDPVETEEWETTVARTVMCGKSGQGIVLLPKGTPRIRCPLYTKYTKSSKEWRVHVIGSDPVLTQRKVRDQRVPDEEVNWQIRNHDNGFIFQVNNEEPPAQDVIDQAVSCVIGLNLDFAAVDVLWSDYYQEAYVLEANTAPSLSGDTTRDAYVAGIQRLLNFYK